MGELLLCNEAIAAMPYYIEGVSINVYSIEELNYYIFDLFVTCSEQWAKFADRFLLLD